MAIAQRNHDVEQAALQGVVATSAADSAGARFLCVGVIEEAYREWAFEGAPGEGGDRVLGTMLRVRDSRTKGTFSIFVKSEANSFRFAEGGLVRAFRIPRWSAVLEMEVFSTLVLPAIA